MLNRANISAARLLLRPSNALDAARAFEIQSDWLVTRMLRMATFPPDSARVSEWFGDHERQWLADEAYRFAIVADGRMVGLVDIDAVTATTGVLGYWLEQSAWGKGFASEAASAAVRFAFSVAGLSELKAAHAEDNPASGRILGKLGFTPLETVERHSHSRGATIRQKQYRLARSPNV